LDFVLFAFCKVPEHSDPPHIKNWVKLSRGSHPELYAVTPGGVCPVVLVRRLSRGSHPEL
jgi:hypothetical protein